MLGRGAGLTCGPALARRRARRRACGRRQAARRVGALTGCWVRQGPRAAAAAAPAVPGPRAPAPCGPQRLPPRARAPAGPAAALPRVLTPAPKRARRRCPAAAARPHARTRGCCAAAHAPLRRLHRLRAPSALRDCLCARWACGSQRGHRRLSALCWHWHRLCTRMSHV